MPSFNAAFDKSIARFSNQKSDVDHRKCNLAKKINENAKGKCKMQNAKSLLAGIST
jgi:hypothetical protein